MVSPNTIELDKAKSCEKEATNNTLFIGKACVRNRDIGKGGPHVNKTKA